MNDYGRNLIRVTKTKEQAGVDTFVYYCPECSRELPLIVYSKKRVKQLDNKCIALQTERVNNWLADFLYLWFESYTKQVFIDKYKCFACGAEWESGKYKCMFDEMTERKIEREFTEWN